MRIAVPALQIIVILLVTITLCITCPMLICYSKHPERFRFRWGQYTALIGGAALWFCALIYFTSLVIYYETLSEENYLLDTNLLSARSAWTKNIRDQTNYMAGPMIPMTWSANLLLYAASLLQLIASTLQKPPKIEV